MKFLLSLLLLMPLSAHATKIVGNGGDTHSLEFVLIAQEVQKYLHQTFSDTFDIEPLALAIADTKVESTDEKLILDGTVKDAINYPTEMRIVFNLGRWSNMPDGERAVLVLHEYLGILGVDDSSYRYSKELLKKMIFNRSVITLHDEFVVNFASQGEYFLPARVSILSTGQTDWLYNAADEKLQIIVEADGERRLFELPIRGRVLAAYNSNDRIDDGIYIKVLQPLLAHDGRPETLELPGEYSIYIPHAVKEYRIEFQNRERGAIPEEIEVLGPIGNQFG